jgi:LmbE family N-acetylglucosaminyl deacetylase
LGAHPPAASEQKLRIKDLAALRALGVREHLGIEIGGTGYFTVRSETWRSVVVATILRPRLYHHRFLATDHIVSRLVEEGYVHSDFVELTKDLADAMRHLDPEFLTPWEAIHRFLQALTKAGVTEQQHLSFALKTGLTDRWRERALTEQKKNERRNGISSLVARILERIPAEDCASMTVESWWQMSEIESGRPRKETFETDTSIDDDLEGILEVLLLRSSASPHNLHGLPAGRAIEEAISRRAENEAKAKAKRAADEADGRRQSMIRLSEQTLDGQDLADFLCTPLADQGGILPLDLAERSFADLGLAEKALRKFAQSRHAERVATEWRSKLNEEARKLFGDRAARVVRQPVDGRLDGLPPLIYCRDEGTFRAVLGVLHWIAQTL